MGQQVVDARGELVVAPIVERPVRAQRLSLQHAAAAVDERRHTVVPGFQQHEAEAFKGRRYHQHARAREQRLAGRVVDQSQTFDQRMVGDLHVRRTGHHERRGGTATLLVSDEIPQQRFAALVRIDSAETEQYRLARNSWRGSARGQRRIEPRADDTGRSKRTARTPGDQLGFLGSQKNVSARQREEPRQNWKADHWILFGGRNQQGAIGHQR